MALKSPPKVNLSSNFGVRFVAIAKVKSRERKAES